MEKGYIRIKKDEQPENGYHNVDILICNEDTDEVIKEVNINNDQSNVDPGTVAVVIERIN